MNESTYLSIFIIITMLLIAIEFLIIGLLSQNEKRTKRRKPQQRKESWYYDHELNSKGDINEQA